jgi:hypothetical protein
MTPSRIATILLSILGLVLIALGFLLPDGERLIRENLPLETHVTVLAPGDEGSILAATQSGEIWRFDGAHWDLEDVDLGGRLVLALRGEPDSHPIGTSAGLLNVPGEPLPDSSRVSDVLETGGGLVVGTPDGVRVQLDGAWHHPLAWTPIYRLAEQRRGDRVYVHAGTIGDGIFSAPIEEMLSVWSANRRGLPEGVKVLSFAVTEGGILLAGTDQGLYWQAQPGDAWERFEAIPRGQRILALYRAATDAQGLQRVWIGGDRGLSAIHLQESDLGLSISGPVQSFAALWEAPEAGVSWILPIEGGVMISAGSAYRLRSSSYPGWYRFSLAGILFLLIGVWVGRGSAGRPNPG